MTRKFSRVQIDMFRRLLEAELAADLGNASSAARNMQLISQARQDSSTDDEHDPEGVTLAFERSQEAAMVRRSERGASEASAALARIQGGTYGVCQACGNDIATDRLEARPTTTVCIECARQQEL